jgi:hypothetical protein
MIPMHASSVTHRDWEPVRRRLARRDPPEGIVDGRIDMHAMHVKVRCVDLVEGVGSQDGLFLIGDGKIAPDDDVVHIGTAG